MLLATHEMSFAAEPTAPRTQAFLKRISRPAASERAATGSSGGGSW